METKDPALSKTRITENDTHETLNESHKVDNYDETVKNHDELEDNITENKGTDTFEEGIVESKHVNDDDNPARQPDRRDQPGNGFDDNINENTVGSEAPDSEEINNMNRYASIDNAQTRVLNPDLKD